MPLTKTINGSLLFQLLQGGYQCLKINEEYLNSINVFPVSDGDTGNNMKKTLEHGIMKMKQSDSFGVVLNSFLGGVLSASRGNSGSILSQFFYGFSSKLVNTANVGIPEFIGALEDGYTSAYKAVLKPVEGTILSVMRQGANMLSLNKPLIKSFEDLFAYYVEELLISVIQTVNELALLKENNVVDSGALGFYFIILGMKHTLTNSLIEQIDYNSVFPNKIRIQNKKPLDFRYCLEFCLYSKNGFSLEVLSNSLKTFGDSLVISKNPKFTSIHIHTNDPFAVLKNVAQYGVIRKTKIDDMSFQNELNSYVKPEYKDDFLIVSYFKDHGSMEILSNLGCDLLFQIDLVNSSFNNSLKQLINKFRHSKIIFFPNDKQLYSKLKAYFKEYKNVIVIDSQTVTKTYFLLQNILVTNAFDRVATGLLELADKEYIEYVFESNHKGIVNIKNKKYLPIKNLENSLDLLFKNSFSKYTMWIIIIDSLVSEEIIGILRNYFEDKVLCFGIEYGIIVNELGNNKALIGAML